MPEFMLDVSFPPQTMKPMNKRRDWKVALIILVVGMCLAVTCGLVAVGFCKDIESNLIKLIIFN